MARSLVTAISVQDIPGEVVSFELARELGRPATLDVEVRFPGDVGMENALGTEVLFQFGYAGEPMHDFAGVVAEVELAGSPVTGSLAELVGGGSASSVRLRIVSKVALLEGSHGAAIYQEMSVPDIVKAVLEEHGVPAAQQRWQLVDTYEPRVYCVRYFETALAFVSRLLEEEGIVFVSEVEDGQEVVVFTDDTPSAGPIEGDPVLPRKGERGFATAGDGVVALAERAEVRSGKIVLLDYDFERPSLDLTSEAEADRDTFLERYDYPGLFVEPSVGKHLAQVRLEAERGTAEAIDAIIECPRLHAGRVVTLGDVIYDELEPEQLVVRVVHRLGGRAVLGEAERDAFERVGREEVFGGPGVYLAEALLVPKSVRYRAPQVTPRPVVHGPHTARVVGPEGAEGETIHTDEHGRCKVKFHWDLGPALDDKASCWIRVAQQQTSGSMILPRLDWEVVVEFLEGNPDRPVVTGKLYNGLFMPPYALPEGKTRTSLQTMSTPGGGGRNEIRFEDRAGGEEIMIHAQYDQTIVTANDKKKEVGNNETRIVGNNETVDVGADQSVKVTKGGRTTVGADESLSVGGNRSVEVNAVSALTVGGSSTSTVGGNHFEMDGNPLEALLALAAEVVTEVAKAAAAQAMDKINGAIQAKVDQAMAPIAGLMEQAQQIQAGIEAVQSGDLGAIADLTAQAAGLPTPTALAEAMGGGGGAEAGRGGGEGGGEGGGDEGGEGGGDEGGEGEGEDDGPSYTEMAGLDAAVNGAIERGVQSGADAIGAALGLGGGGGGGSSGANKDGPEGAVEGIDGEDREKGPGHNTRVVSGDYTESVGAIKLGGALTGVHTEVGGDVSETVGLAKVTLAYGTIATTSEGDSTVKTLGRIVVTKADESVAAEGAMTLMTGGLVYEKVGGSKSVTAGAPASFVGAFHKIEAATAITLTCGASEVVIDGGGITITSPLVTVMAGKISLTKAVAEV